MTNVPYECKTVIIGEIGCEEYGNSLYHLHSCSVNRKLFQNKNCIKPIEGLKLVIIHSLRLREVELGAYAGKASRKYGEDILGTSLG